MNRTDKYLVWLVLANHLVPSSWTGRKFALGIHDAKMYGMKSEAEAVAAKHGAHVEAFSITPAPADDDADQFDFGETLEANGHLQPLEFVPTEV